MTFNKCISIFMTINLSKTMNYKDQTELLGAVQTMNYKQLGVNYKQIISNWE